MRKYGEVETRTLFYSSWIFVFAFWKHPVLFQSLPSDHENTFYDRCKKGAAFGMNHYQVLLHVPDISDVVVYKNF